MKILKWMKTLLKKKCSEVVELVDPISGLTPTEDRCHDFLMQSISEFHKLERQHPQEMEEFCTAVHNIQDLLAMRLARREYPKFWKTYDKEKK